MTDEEVMDQALANVGEFTKQLTEASTEVYSILHDAGLHDSVWGRKIIDGHLRGWFNPEDKHSAQRWTECACGNLDKRISRHWENGPEDSRLRHLGRNFAQEVHANYFRSSAKTLVEIEERALQLIEKQARDGV